MICGKRSIPVNRESCQRAYKVALSLDLKDMNTYVNRWKEKSRHSGRQSWILRKCCYGRQNLRPIQPNPYFLLTESTCIQVALENSWAQVEQGLVSAKGNGLWLVWRSHVVLMHLCHLLVWGSQVIQFCQLEIRKFTLFFNKKIVYLVGPGFFPSSFSSLFCLKMDQFLRNSS